MSLFNGLPPGSLYTTHRGQLGGRGLSPRLWARWKDTMMSPDGASNGYMIGDDFLQFGTIAPVNSTTTYGVINGGNLGYGAFVDSSGSGNSSIAQQADTFGGTIKMSTAAVDNTQAILQGGGGTGGILNIDDLNNPALQIFECRFKLGQVGNSLYDAFFGFADPGLAKTQGVFTTADALQAANNFLGFQILTAAGGTIKFIYQAANGVQQLPFTLSTALVVNTWYKVGFVYNPHSIPSRRLTVMLNNDQGTVTQSVPVPSSGPIVATPADGNVLSATQLQAATFPSATFLAPTFALMNNGANINSISLDWWNLAGAGQTGGGGEEGGPL